MVAVRLEDLANVLAGESGSKFVGLEKLIPELSGWRAELVALIPMALAAQPRRVVGCQWRTTAGAAATTVPCPACRLPGRNHHDPPSELQRHPRQPYLRIRTATNG